MNLPFFKNIKIQILPLALGLGAVVLLALLFPQFKNLARLSKEVAEKKQVLKEVDLGIKKLANLEAELNSLRITYENFISRLPPEKEFPVFLEIISEIAKRNNIKIIAMEPEKPMENNKLFYVQSPVSIDATCGYHDLGRFINDIEFSPKFMKIEELKLESSNEDNTPHHVLLTLNAFCFKEVEKKTVEKRKPSR